MFVSVIIPTCHRNDLLGKCLDCLAPHKQSLPAECYEVIVTDDGLKSTAQELVKQNYPWARWIAGPRRGPATNRNNGAKFARGDWLIFTDDDCLPETIWLSEYVKAIETGGASVYEGRTYTEPNSKGPFWVAPTNETGGYLWSCNLAIHRNAFFSINGFDDSFPYPHLEDVDFRERLKAVRYAFTFCRAAAVFHPFRPVASATHQALGHESYFYYARKHNKTLKQSGLSVRSYLLSRLRWFKISRGPLDTARFMVRCAVEGFIVAIMSPWWLLKFRSSDKQT